MTVHLAGDRPGSVSSACRPAPATAARPEPGTAADGAEPRDGAAGVRVAPRPQPHGGGGGGAQAHPVEAG
ncbi:hypothetical protein LQ327_09555 [Actinomycetospora endophytica]|uniref:Uncharacterized protein n=1 Tax=Actinomycetospora endophytica TaxID=2291215 RepID=A0ABS8P5W5_9PSEU|nr:hypothetical protein [Actinomycetospora endophytica]MCD2193626.1 hypothetical protein [Actinomycetospora endophytica]